MNHDIPNILYHYCSLQALQGIIEGKCLYMTNVFWMDDTTELLWFYEVVNRLLDRRRSNERNTVRGRFQNLIKDPRPTHVFCACFSEVPDSRSQWLEYADGGHGFTIGFDPTTFDLEQARDIELKPVIYDEKEQEKMAEALIGELREREDDLADNVMLWAVGHNTWRHAALCKNPAFKDEQEWRLICRGDPGNALDFRERAGRHLIPFTRFQFDPAKRPIREIWLGPRNRSQRNVDAVAELLRHCGYDADAVRYLSSQVPLRPEY